MVCASFLVEYLRVSWTDGAAWFHDTLVDADSAINAMMWQNAGRSGIDQWNFVLSPENGSQDASGRYVRRWCPELARLPSAKHLHQPWKASAEGLAEAGVVLDETYPARVVVDLAAERRTSVESVLAMRRQHQDLNDARGYDLITIPSVAPGGPPTTVSKVFTKEEYRIGRDGAVLPPPPRRSGGGRGRGRGRGGRGAAKVKATEAVAVVPPPVPGPRSTEPRRRRGRKNGRA